MTGRIDTDSLLEEIHVRALDALQATRQSDRVRVALQRKRLANFTYFMSHEHETNGAGSQRWRRRGSVPINLVAAQVLEPGELGVNSREWLSSALLVRIWYENGTKMGRRAYCG